MTRPEYSKFFDKVSRVRYRDKFPKIDKSNVNIFMKVALAVTLDVFPKKEDRRSTEFEQFKSEFKGEECDDLTD